MEIASRNPERSRRAILVLQHWYTYIVRCRDGSFYVGITNNVITRVGKHNLGLGSKYVFSRRPVELVYSEEFKNKSEARKRELQIKGWTRRKKELLVERELFR